MSDEPMDEQDLTDAIKRADDCYLLGSALRVPHPGDPDLREMFASANHCWKSARGAIKQQPAGTAEAVIREMRDEQ